LERAKGSSFNKDNFFHQIRILPKAEQIKGLQKLIDLGKISEVFITIEEYQAQGLEEIAYRCTPDDFHDLHLSPEEVDSKIEQSGPVLYQAFLKCGATPEESFYKKNKTLFFDGNNLKESFLKDLEILYLLECYQEQLKV
jgi:hypothetical protein